MYLTNFFYIYFLKIQIFFLFFLINPDAIRNSVMKAVWKKFQKLSSEIIFIFRALRV